MVLVLRINHEDFRFSVTATSTVRAVVTPCSPRCVLVNTQFIQTQALAARSLLRSQLTFVLWTLLASCSVLTCFVFRLVLLLFETVQISPFVSLISASAY